MTKRNWLGLLPFAFCFETASAKVDIYRSAGDKVVYDFAVEDIKFTDIEMNSEIFVQAKLQGVDGYEGIVYEVGKPEIPVIRLMVEGKSVEIGVDKREGIETWSIPSNRRLYPSQPSWNKSHKKRPKFTIDNDSYDNPKSSPYYTVEAAGSIRGIKRWLVTLYPMRPNARSYELNNHFTVTLTQEAEPLKEQRELVALIVGKSFAQSPSLQDYENYKLEEGYTTKRLVIGQDVNSAADIRRELQELLKTRNLRYAVLIGDIEQVPSYPATKISGVTDHYYRAIDTDNYATDINGPDIGVGRVSVSNEGELAIVLGKFMRYGKGEFANRDWLNSPSFITTHDQWRVAEATHKHVIDTYTASAGYVGAFPKNPQAGGDMLFPISNRASASHMMSAINAGRFIVNYSGHGSHTGWEDIGAGTVRNITNQDALPYVISNSCITGNFRVKEVYAETWLRHPRGAIAFWGSMDNTYWTEDDILEKNLYKGIFTLNKRRFDDMQQYALGEFWRHFGGRGYSSYYWESYVTFGDPTLELRTSAAE